MESKSLYEVLGVDPQAMDEEIYKAYKSKAQKCHPEAHTIYLARSPKDLFYIAYKGAKQRSESRL